MQCGCSDIAVTSIEEWEKLYTDRYGHKYVEKHCNPEKSRICNLSIPELKQELLGSEDWREIIKEIEPSFKSCYPKFDTITLFFDALTMEKRLDELRNKLIEHKTKNGRKDKQEGSEEAHL